MTTAKQAAVLKLSDDEIARLLVHAIVEQPSGTVLGALQLARAIGLPYGGKDRERGISRVTRCTNRAVEVAGELYPGMHLSVDRSGGWGTYRMLGELDDAACNALDTLLKQADTKAHRVEVVSEGSNNPRAIRQNMAAKMARFALAQALGEPVHEQVKVPERETVTT